MKVFKDFNIKAEQSGFIGDKVKISKILNKLIVICSYKVENSTQNAGKCLHMQIELDGAKRVVFTGSNGLISMIQKVPEDGFPFQATIIENNDRYEFN